MTKDVKELLNMPVLTISTGKEMGTVEQFLFEPGAHRLYGIIVKSSTKDEPDTVVLSAKIKSFGDKAVTIVSEQDATVFAADIRAQELARESTALNGIKVLTADGNEVGTIDTILINDDGTVAAYHTSSGLLGRGAGKDIAPDMVISAGKDAIIVSGVVLQES